MASIFDNLKTFGDYQREEEEFQLRKQKLAQEARAAGGNRPSTLQISDAIKERLDQGDVEGANRIMQVHRAGAYGVNTYGDPNEQPFSAPTTPTNPQPEAPSESNSVLGALGTLGQMFGNNAPVGNTPAGNVAPAQPRVATPAAGIGNALAHNAALKKAAEEQAQKNVQLNMNPRITAAEKIAESDATTGIADSKTLPIIQDLLNLNKDTYDIPIAGSLNPLLRMLPGDGNARRTEAMDLMLQGRLAAAAPLAKLLGVNPTDKDFQSTLDQIFDENSTKGSREAQIRKIEQRILDRQTGKVDLYKRGEDAFKAKKGSNLKSKYGLE